MLIFSWADTPFINYFNFGRDSIIFCVGPFHIIWGAANVMDITYFTGVNFVVNNLFSTAKVLHHYYGVQITVRIL